VQARTVSGMDRVPFDSLLAQRKVAWGGSPDDALDDMQAARAAIRPDRT
jgi:hypothetical protein